MNKRIRAFTLSTFFFSCLITPQRTHPLLQNFAAATFGVAATLLVDGGLPYNPGYFALDAIRLGTSIFGATPVYICTGLKLIYILGPGNDPQQLAREAAYLATYVITKEFFLK
jgi:hypothetical protein